MKINLGFASLLTLLFIYLTLTSVITWSWVWVLAPVWIPLIFVIGLLLFAAFLVALTGKQHGHY